MFIYYSKYRVDTSESLELSTSPEDIFPRLQQGVISANHKIKTVVPNQTIVTEGKHDFATWIMVLLILFCWPGAIIYYFASKRSSLTIIVTKHGESGCTITINSNGKDGDKVRKYMFYHLQQNEKKPGISDQTSDGNKENS